MVQSVPVQANNTLTLGPTVLILQCDHNLGIALGLKKQTIICKRKLIKNKLLLVGVLRRSGNKTPHTRSKYSYLSFEKFS